jgi:hypothetical protein
MTNQITPEGVAALGARVDDLLARCTAEEALLEALAFQVRASCPDCRRVPPRDPVEPYRGAGPLCRACFAVRDVAAEEYERFGATKANDLLGDWYEGFEIRMPVPRRARAA